MTAVDVQPAPAVDPDAILTRREAAAYLRVSLKILDRLPITRVKLGHRTVRYRMRDILAYLDRSGT